LRKYSESSASDVNATRSLAKKVMERRLCPSEARRPPSKLRLHEAIASTFDVHPPASSTA
jgi:hypothetical protein